MIWDSAGNFTSGGSRYEMHRGHLRGPDAGHEPLRLGLFAGIHGDEPAGTEALLSFGRQLVVQPWRAAGYELWLYPMVNPVGCDRGTRENESGKDLNREFWRSSAEGEVRIIEEEMERIRFDGIIALHADDTCEGHYGYSHGRALDDALLRPALLAAERILPRDGRSEIDGFAASEGVIRDCYPGILSPPPRQDPRPFNVIFETPASAPFEKQVAAHVAALEAILSTYRGFISYAQGL